MYLHLFYNYVIVRVFIKLRNYHEKEDKLLDFHIHSNFHLLCELKLS